MNLLVLYSLSNWLPIVVTGMGYQTQTAVLVGTVLQVGGTIGTFGLAWLIARAGFIPMLAATFALATVSIALIGQPGISLAMLTVIVFVAGWGVIGGQPGINALVGHVLSHLAAHDRRRLGPRRRPHRRDRRALSRREAARVAVGPAGIVLGGRNPRARLHRDDGGAALHDEAPVDCDGRADAAPRLRARAITDACRCDHDPAGATRCLSVRSAILVGAILDACRCDPDPCWCDLMLSVQSPILVGATSLTLVGAIADPGRLPSA